MFIICLTDVFTMFRMWHCSDYKTIHIAKIREIILMNNDVFVSKFVSFHQVNIRSNLFLCSRSDVSLKYSSIVIGVKAWHEFTACFLENSLWGKCLESGVAKANRKVVIISSVASVLSALLLLTIGFGTILYRNKRYKRYLLLQVQQSKSYLQILFTPILVVFIS